MKPTLVPGKFGRKSAPLDGRDANGRRGNELFNPRGDRNRVATRLNKSRGRKGRRAVTWHQEEPSQEEWENGEQEPTFPKSPTSLRYWLRDTDEGRKVLREATEEFLECRRCQRLLPYPRVLVVGRIWDGKPSVDIHWDEGVTVQTIQLVDTEFGEEGFADDALLAELHPSWQYLADTGRRTETMTLLPKSIREKVNGIVKLRILRAIQDQR